MRWIKLRTNCLLSVVENKYSLFDGRRKEVLKWMRWRNTGGRKGKTKVERETKKKPHTGINQKSDGRVGEGGISYVAAGASWHHFLFDGSNCLSVWPSVSNLVTLVILTTDTLPALDTLGGLLWSLFLTQSQVCHWLDVFTVSTVLVIGCII